MLVCCSSSVCVFCFFFKQKTAYEMRISDWSSDVCSSDLGCEQVVFLDAVERRWVEELGGMNVFFVFDDGSLQTPPLTGTILPGITRDSLITLARGMGLTVRAEPYAIDQWQAEARQSVVSGTSVSVSVKPGGGRYNK